MELKEIAWITCNLNFFLFVFVRGWKLREKIVNEMIFIQWKLFLVLFVCASFNFYFFSERNVKMIYLHS